MTCKVVRIGVFFDGTGNNLYNDEEADKSKSANGVSNVGKLYRLYRDGEELEGNKITECKVYVKAIYIEGVGTISPTKKPDKQVNVGYNTVIHDRTDGCQPGREGWGTVRVCDDEKYEYHDDYMTGGGMGALGGQRIDRAISQVLAIFDTFSAGEYKRQIDVFGFSRGAAMARDFINTMYTRHYKLPYTFKFVGLFDTVASFGVAGDNENWKPKDTDGFLQEGNLRLLAYEKSDKTDVDEKKWVTKYYEEYNLNLRAGTESAEDEEYNLKLRARTESAEHIVHFIALDEYRKNFPLTDTQGAGLTYDFVGAHSDVGGGYPATSHEDIFDYQAGYNRSTEQGVENLQTTKPLIGENWTCYDVRIRGYKRGVMCNGKRTVSNDLQKVTLVAMHKQARLAGVPFKESINATYGDVPDHYGQIDSCCPDWSDELKMYYQAATQNISALAGVLNQGEKINIGASGDLLAERNLIHLSLLAKYGHNSSGTLEMDKHRAPPLGFKNRNYDDMTDLLKSPMRRVGEDKIPQRAVFANNASKAKNKL